MAYFSYVCWGGPGIMSYETLCDIFQMDNLMKTPLLVQDYRNLSGPKGRKVCGNLSHTLHIHYKYVSVPCVSSDQLQWKRKGYNLNIWKGCWSVFCGVCLNLSCMWIICYTHDKQTSCWMVEPLPYLIHPIRTHTLYCFPPCLKVNPLLTAKNINFFVKNYGS